ncbi:MAG: hypothetical protein CMO34_04025 [Verrucomicrobia bacterium]|nr:hypothetical protein [Verrucomicrobiota bacterium]|tara:strand:+ start:1177 stop:1512 length:336 start_codon:yes stop_codon:yes gene_type:complete
MEAIISKTVQMETTSTQAAQLNWFNRQVANFEESRFGVMAMMLAVQTCWGSIAAGLSYSNETILGLALCGTFTMLNNTVLIAQGPAKWCVGIFSAAIIVNTIIILIELIGG